VLARRIETYDQVELGDLAYKHETGSVFHVEDLAADAPRAAAVEISPTGPLLGYRMTPTTGHPLEIEQSVFATYNLVPEQFRHSGQHRIKGARRPLRIRPTDIELAGGVDDDGPHITVAFTLPAGAFATVVMAEVMKTDEGAGEQAVVDSQSGEQMDDANEGGDEGDRE
jgi:tRNA pseudouridine13 synthase